MYHISTFHITQTNNHRLFLTIGTQKIYHLWASPCSISINATFIRHTEELSFKARVLLGIHLAALIELFSDFTQKLPNFYIQKLCWHSKTHP